MDGETTAIIIFSIWGMVIFYVLFLFCKEVD